MVPSKKLLECNITPFNTGKHQLVPIMQALTYNNHTRIMTSCVILVPVSAP